MRLAIALLCVLLFVPFVSAQEPAKIRQGDVLVVQVLGEKDYSGEYPVLNDGSITGSGIGRLVVAGKTVAEVEKLVTEVLRKRFVKPSVSVFYKFQRPEVVYLINAGQGLGTATAQPVGGESAVASSPVGGVVALSPGMDLRRLLSGVPLGMDADQLQLTLTRGGSIVARARVSDVMDPSMPLGAEKLQSDDLVTILPMPFVRAWVNGEVVKPGQVRLSSPQADLQTLLASAGGLTPNGTLQNILVMRRGDAIRVDASSVVKGTAPKAFPIEDGDVVYVRTNDRIAAVVGEVRKPGRVVLADGREYRASDLLALSEGLTDKGSLRRVVLARFTPDGKMAIQQFNLDEYLKDGKLESNPVIQPDDVLLFGTPKGITLNSVVTAGQVLTPLVILDSLFRR